MYIYTQQYKGIQQYVSVYLTIYKYIRHIHTNIGHMYICIAIQQHIYIYIHIYSNIYIYMYTAIYISTYIAISIEVYSNIYIYINI